MTMLNIIIPLAGSSHQFPSSEYAYPKPLIEVNGVPLIELVLRNPLSIQVDKRFIFIVREDECRKYHLDATLTLLAPGCVIVKLKGDTQGALCSVLMAIDVINEMDSLIILNGDQIVDTNLSVFLDDWDSTSADVGLVTFSSTHPKWSYARISNDAVIQTAEKNPISRNAIAGIYFFKTASDFFENSFKTLMNDTQLDGFFYISSVVNEYILSGHSVRRCEMRASEFHLVNTPQALKLFESNLKS